MLPQVVFLSHLVFGYVACLLLYVAYVLPAFKAMEPVRLQRVIATVHSFRFLGLVFILPGVVGPGLPPGFAAYAAYGDLATALLALLALVTVRVRPVFWFFVVAFNLAGIIDILIDYYEAMRHGLADVAGQLGAAYFIPVIYVPALMITHCAAFYFMRKRR